jgi:outer membrane lipoprotein SlyB
VKRVTLLLGAGAIALGACASETPEQAAQTRHEVGCFAGTMSGGVLGGLAGSLVGGGTGRAIAAAVGAGAGAFAGERLACR